MTCDQATTICDKQQYKETVFLEKVKLKLHIFMCAKCRHYSTQNKIITKVCDKHGKEQKTSCLSSKEKTTIEQKLFNK